MKNVLTTIILTGSIAFCFAQKQQYPQRGGRENQHTNYPQQRENFGRKSSLLISAASQRQLSVAIDNRTYENNGNDNTIKIGQINAGNHRLVVYQWKKNFWGKRVRDVVYNSQINLRPGYETSIFINDGGIARINERPLNNNGNYGKGGNGNNDRGRDWGYSKKKHKHKKNNSGKYEEDRRNSDWRQDERWERDND